MLRKISSIVGGILRSRGSRHHRTTTTPRRRGRTTSTGGGIRSLLRGLRR